MTTVPRATLRRLPRCVTPFPGEIMSSYLARMAKANRVDPETLRRYIAGDSDPRVLPVAQVAAVAGVPAPTLERAIADLDSAAPARTSNDSYHWTVDVCTRVIGWACHLCAFARGASGPVMCWKPAEEMVCLRHLRWTGSDDPLQPALDRQPDIVEAQRRHRRLVRRHGREEVTAGTEVAGHICHKWYQWRQKDAEFNRRLEVFHGPGWVLPQVHPTIRAAAYPQVVALARLLASPYWRALAVGDSSAGRALFGQELKRTVAPSCQWPQQVGSTDPLYRWLFGNGRFDQAALNWHASLAALRSEAAAVDASTPGPPLFSP
jgi:hypothetical protein